MGIEIITNDTWILNKGITFTPGQKGSITRFVNKNCSYYFFLNFIRMTEGNVADAIKLYRFDEELRNLILKYILRLEVQMKKDFIYYVEQSTNDNSFWNNPIYYKNQFVRSTTGFNQMLHEANNRMNKMNYNGTGPINNRMFYSTSFGTFKKIYSNIKGNYLTSFTSKYFTNGSNTKSKLNAYLSALHTVRNRCCHSNHLISQKFQFTIESTNIVLDNINNVNLNTNFEKLLYFINDKLDYKSEMKKEFLKLLNSYYNVWIIYVGRHILSVDTINNIINYWK